MSFDFENNIDTSSNDSLALNDVYLLYKQALQQFNFDIIRSKDNPYTLNIVHSKNIRKLDANTPVCLCFSTLFFTLYKVCPSAIDFFNFNIDGIYRSVCLLNPKQTYTYIFLYEAYPYFSQFCKMIPEDDGCLVIKNIDITALLSYCKFISKLCFNWWENASKYNIYSFVLGLYKSTEYLGVSRRAYFPILHNLTKKELLELICTAYHYKSSFLYFQIDRIFWENIIKNIQYNCLYAVKSYNLQKFQGNPYFVDVFQNIFQELKDEGIIPEDYSKYILSI